MGSGATVLRPKFDTYHKWSILISLGVRYGSGRAASGAIGGNRPVSIFLLRGAIGGAWRQEGEGCDKTVYIRERAELSRFLTVCICALSVGFVPVSF